MPLKKTVSSRRSSGRAAAPKPLVAILMGSDSDLEIMAEAARALREFDVPHEVLVASAHRSPDRTARYVRRAPGRGIRVLIAGAGGAAHLAGVVAAGTILPVIGVPLPGSALNGLDALLATVQMPAGVPVATVAIGKAGARNAGYLAVAILALSDARLTARLQRHRASLAKGVDEKSRGVPRALARLLS